MTQPVAILVPVLDRPGNVRPLLDSIAAATPESHSVLFIADPDDHPEQEAIRQAGGELLIHAGTYAQKITVGVTATNEPLVFTAADDLDFQPGWLPAAVAHLDPAQVIGVNDLIDRRMSRQGHATHFLMTRDYAQQPTLDGRPGPFSDVYTHSFCDDELIATATHRGVYAYAAESHVRHLHPMNATAPDDDTYRKGRAGFRMDRRLFERRSSLWTSR